MIRGARLSLILAVRRRLVVIRVRVIAVVRLHGVSVFILTFAFVRACVRLLLVRRRLERSSLWA